MTRADFTVAECGRQFVHRVGDVDARAQQVGDPQRQAVDEDDVARLRRRNDRVGEVDRFLDRREPRCTLRLVRADAVAHLVVERRRRGEIGRALAQPHRQPLREPRLAGSRTAQNQDVPQAHDRLPAVRRPRESGSDRG
ncbi:MAG: hypothetical protein V9G20_30275 [Candidatus Promineifilaceae bacterium]